jgi:hypothetical protein
VCAPAGKEAAEAAEAAEARDAKGAKETKEGKDAKQAKEATGSGLNEPWHELLRDVPSSLHIRLDELSFTRRIGAGGAGVTYLAAHRGSAVAVKLAHGGGVDDWRREVAAFAQLSHPHVVALATAHTVHTGLHTLRSVLSAQCSVPADGSVHCRCAVSASSALRRAWGS